MNDAPAADRSPPAHTRRLRWGLLAAVSLPLIAALAHRAWSTGWPPERGRWVAYSIMLLQEEESLLLPDTKRSAVTEERRWARYRVVQAAMVKSRLVLSAALRAPGVMNLAVLKGKDDPIQWLQQNVQVTFPDAEELMHIRLTAGTPEDGITLVKAISDAYLNEVIDKERRLRLNRLEQIKDLLSKYNQERSAKEQALRNLKKDIGSSPLDRETLSYYRKELCGTHVALLRARARLECLSANAGRDEVKATAAKLREEISVLEKLEEALAQKCQSIQKDEGEKQEKQADRELLATAIAAEEDIVRRLAAEQEALKVALNDRPRVAPFQDAAAERVR
jgi:hypothetical protein